SWPFLASIGTQECGTTGTCSGVNASGCAGPMQIAYVRQSPCSPGSGPTLWERFAVDGNGDGTKDVNELADAIFTAARILRQDLGAPPIGGSYAAYRQAACRYYGACADAVANYADEVMARAVRYGFRSGGAPAAAESTQQAAVQGPVCEGSAVGAASTQAIVRIAERQLGREERPPGSNCTPYGPCEEWCSLFVAWVWEHAGVPMRGGTSPYAYSGSIYEWAKAHGGRILLPGARPAPGDAVLFGLGPTASAHVAIVERVFPDGEITTIDGNYSNRVARVGPYSPSLDVVGGEPALIYAYAQPPGVGVREGGVNG
ncbi:MAG TPA: CHAP domain-containing protein, partial [Solirubrobacterales bacterium]|nr:CHAP domain-containing protein [Solirubrobacterales bacterium]